MGALISGYMLTILFASLFAWSFVQWQAEKDSRDKLSKTVHQPPPLLGRDFPANPDNGIVVLDPKPTDDGGSYPRKSGDVTTFIVDISIGNRALEIMPSLSAGMNSPIEDIDDPSYKERGYSWTHGDMVAYSFHVHSTAPMIGVGIMASSDMFNAFKPEVWWDQYLNALRWIIAHIKTNRIEKCIINHSWAVEYKWLKGIKPFNTEENELLAELESLNCVAVATVPNHWSFQLCDRKVTDPHEQWMDKDLPVDVDTNIEIHFPQFRSRGRGLLIGMYNHRAHSFPLAHRMAGVDRSEWEAQGLDTIDTVGWGPCVRHAPGVNTPIGPARPGSPGPHELGSGSSMATPIASAFLNCYWTRRPELNATQAVIEFERDCFTDTVLHNTPYPNFAVDFAISDGTFTKRGTPLLTERTTRILDTINCPCS